jgi:putative hydrolase of the HAD superfamily
MSSADRIIESVEMIFFDIDDTLIDHTWAEMAASRQFHSRHGERLQGISLGQFATVWHDAAEHYMGQFLAGQMDMLQQRRARIFEIFKFRDDTDEADRLFGEYLELYEAAWILFDDVESCLRDLDGRRLGIITNGNTEQQRRKLKVTRIDELFETVITSEMVGVAKPDQGIFEAAANAAGLDPEKCCYVGDRLKTDALAAIDAEMHGVWVNRRRVNAPPCQAIEISSLRKLSRHLA